ncbi:MAG: hypothetical protein ACRCTQ_01080 [Brevinemataceae bacterium]
MQENQNSISSTSTKVLVIKGKFKFETSNVYGLFSILINIDLCIIIESYIIISYFSDLGAVNIKQSWFKLEELFNDMKITGNFAENYTRIFEKLFKEVLKNNNTIESIISDYNKHQIKKIENLMTDIFARMQKDKHLSLELGYEETSLEDLKIIRSTRIQQETPSPNVELINAKPIQIDTNAISIPAFPILAPISGSIKSQSLQPGTKILMKLDSSTPYGQEWIETFHALDHRKGEIIPVVAKVDQISPIIKKSLDILVYYNKNQYTKFNIETDVRLKAFDPSSKEKMIIPEDLQDKLSPEIQQEPETTTSIDYTTGFAQLLVTLTILAVIGIISFFVL